MGLHRHAAFIFCLIGLSTPGFAQAQKDTEWPAYGSDAGGMRYSASAQINRSNVANLKVAWTYRTGSNDIQTKLKRKAAFEATPVVVDGKLFLTTPYDHVIAIDPENGKKLWEYDPGVNLERNYSEVSSRGVSIWRDGGKKAGELCKLRVLVGTMDARLIALDGDTGKACAGFGASGTVDLPVSTAVGLSARFPWITPSGWFRVMRTV